MESVRAVWVSDRPRGLFQGSWVREIWFSEVRSKEAGSGPLIGKAMIQAISETVEKFRRNLSTTESAWTSGKMELMIVVQEAQRPATNLAPNR